MSKTPVENSHTPEKKPRKTPFRPTQDDRKLIVKGLEHMKGELGKAEPNAFFDPKELVARCDVLIDNYKLETTAIPPANHGSLQPCTASIPRAPSRPPPGPEGAPFCHPEGSPHAWPAQALE